VQDLTEVRLPDLNWEGVGNEAVEGELAEIEFEVSSSSEACKDNFAFKFLWKCPTGELKIPDDATLYIVLSSN
jgi:hypothetical protein